MCYISGPISEVEWVEQVVPVFGKINANVPIKPNKKSEDSNMKTYFVSLIIGAIIVVPLSQVWKQKLENRKKQAEESEILVFSDQSFSTSCSISASTRSNPPITKSQSTSQSEPFVQTQKTKNDIASESFSHHQKVFPIEDVQMGKKSSVGKANTEETKVIANKRNEEAMKTTTFQVNSTNM